MRLLFAIVCTHLILSSCTEDRYFEENYDFKDRTWAMEDSVEFKFEIDSLSAPYQFKLNIRNTLDYPYRNLYIQYKLKDSSLVIKDQLINLQLFEGKSGKPFGSNQSEIYEHQVMIEDSLFFPAKGKYTIQLRQYMRQRELEGIISTGIRIDQLPNQTL